MPWMIPPPPPLVPNGFRWYLDEIHCEYYQIIEADTLNSINMIAQGTF